MEKLCLCYGMVQQHFRVSLCYVFNFKEQFLCIAISLFVELDDHDSQSIKILASTLAMKLGLGLGKATTTIYLKQNVGIIKSAEVPHVFSSVNEDGHCAIAFFVNALYVSTGMTKDSSKYSILHCVIGGPMNLLMRGKAVPEVLFKKKISACSSSPPPS